MTSLKDPPRPSAPPAREHELKRPRRSSASAALMARGEPMVWLTGGGMAVCVAMIVALLLFVGYQGVRTFWPVPVVRIDTIDGRSVMGEVTRHSSYQPESYFVDALPDAVAAQVNARLEASDGWAQRQLVRTGNFELTGEHFTWVSDFEITADSERLPPWALVIERQSWGRFYGEPLAFVIDGEVAADQPQAVWDLFEQHHPAVRDRWAQRVALEKDRIGHINHQLEQRRLALRAIELKQGIDSQAWKDAAAEFEAFEQQQHEHFVEIREQIASLNEENDRYVMRLVTADGTEKNLPLAEVVRAYPANRVGFGEKLGIYVSRWWEFLSDDPREANSEGGVLPAIFGTVTMTLLMSLAVVPFGVLAALYLREYAKAGPMISAVRIAINNLAGVPSIVFGVFGVGFFAYVVGARIDQLLFAPKLPSPTFGTGGLLWASLTLALLTLPVVIIATEEALAAVPNSMREGSYACGASKWQTIRRIVLPRAMPGIMTGSILAMARGAGEVAPLMLIGAVKLAPELPIDGYFPYVHLERSFMHLGFHIYDLGFQSQNSAAAKPMVYTTTLLLILIIATLNLLAIWLRGRLRRRFVGSQF